MNALSDDRLERILTPFGVAPDATLFSSIRSYIEILLLWNLKISLTSVEDPEEIARFHFGESFFANSVLPLQSGRLSDVGSGAGFPGIPIKMLSPDLSLFLIESNTKKSAFLNEVLRKVDLRPATVLNARMEDSVATGTLFDFVTARAVGDHDGLLKWAGRHLAPTGRILLFVGSSDADRISRGVRWSWTAKKIPNAKQRVLLIGTRI